MSRRCGRDWERPVTELETLRRRRELVLISAELQRATVVRRLERVGRHPAHAVLGFLTRAATLPILLKVAAIVLGRIGRRRPSKGPRFSILGFLSTFRFSSVLKFFPVLKSLNR
jgi:hypothetical protein